MTTTAIAWSSDVPVEPGYYWFRRDGRPGQVVLLEVETTGGVQETLVTFIGSRGRFPAVMPAEWSGPLVAPSAPSPDAPACCNGIPVAGGYFHTIDCRRKGGKDA